MVRAIPLPLSISNGLTLAEIGDELINLIAINFGVQAGNTDVTIAPVIDQTRPISSTFTFSALSGRLYTSNPSAVRVTEQSNMLIKGSGYTTATPIINQVPSIYGFSGIKNNPAFQLEDGIGRTAYPYPATIQTTFISTMSIPGPIPGLVPAVSVRQQGISRQQRRNILST